MSLIKVCEVSKSYESGDGIVKALKNINLPQAN